MDTKGWGTNVQPNTQPNVQPASQRPGVTIRGRRFGLPWIVGGVVVMLVVISCGCCGVVGLAGALNNGNVTAHATATSAKVVTKATATTAKPTATPNPHAVHAAVLGGTENDFQMVLGTPFNLSQDTRSYYATTGSVKLTIAATLAPGTQGQRFALLNILPTDNTVTWSPDTAYAVARLLIPNDAKYVKDVNISGIGVEHLYTSASLAASFPASQFTNVDTGDTVAPGTLSIMCGGAGTTQGGCQISTGE